MPYGDHMRVHIIGRDRVGWSLDQDYMHTSRFLREIGVKVTRSWFFASAIHSVCWYDILNRKNLPLRLGKLLVAVASSEPNFDSPEFKHLSKLVSLWIAPSKRLLDRLHEKRLQCAFQPFYVDEGIFRNRKMSREELCRILGLSAKELSGKFLVGSFQRDSLGTDPSKPKWQKNPDLLVDILSKFVRSRPNVLLVLAGPRRHYIIEKCKEQGVPYLFVGRHPVPNVDDVPVNTLSVDRISMLYNLVDAYVVSSKSEGGPKAVPEAALSKTLLISTDVGLAPDYLTPRAIYSTAEQALELLETAHDDLRFRDALIEDNYQKAYGMGCRDAFRERWEKVYLEILPQL